MRGRSSSIRCLWLTVAVAASVLAVGSIAFQSPAVRAEAIPSVAVAELPGLPVVTSDGEARLLESVKHLASDELEGRGVGTPGLALAGDYVRSEFQKAGLDITRVENDAFQKFSMVTGTELTRPNTLRFALPDGKTVELKLDRDFRTCSFGGAGTFEADVVFCGYGIEDKETKYDDFAGVDVKGKVVVMMRRNPRQSDPHGAFGDPHGGTSRHADLRTKVNNAVSRGAAAIVFVNDPHGIVEAARRRVEAQKKKDARAAAGKSEPAKPADKTAEKDEKEAGAVAEEVKVEAVDDALMAFGYGGRGNDGSIPIVHVTNAAFNGVLEASLKTSLASLEAAIDKDLKPQSAAIPGVKAIGQTALKRVSAEVRNVIGVLEGQGPLADETIVIGAHYDHVGRGGEGSLAGGSKEVHNGADDNASGTAALIELARRLASRPERLPRRVVFIAFTAEELGLIGSARYVKEPLYPLEKTVAMLNMDMVGRLRDDKLIVYGTGTSSRWQPLLETHGRGFKLTYKPEGFGPSDHSSFYAKKIPVLHFFTGNHSDYHRPGDDWQKINYEGMERIVELLERIVVEAATASDRPDFIEVKTAVAQARSGNRPYVGTIPDFGTDTPGYAITGAAPGSPAEQGGLKGGDVIVEMGGAKITGLDDFDLTLRKFKGGDEVDLVVLRGGERVRLQVKLGQPR